MSSGSKIVMRLRLPERLDLSSVLRFAKEFDGCERADEVIIDMGPQRHFPPFAMLLIGSKIKKFVSYYREVKFRFESYRNHSYASHMGFFDFCDFDHGKIMGAVDGGINYLPITQIRRKDLYEKKGDEYVELPDLVQRHADKIADVISRQSSKHQETHDVLSFSVRPRFIMMRRGV